MFKRFLTFTLMLLMVVSLAIPTISAESENIIDARELEEYGQKHFYLGAPAEDEEIPDVTDGKVSDDEYKESFEAEVDPTNSDPVTYWADHDKDMYGNPYGSYWDNEWSKFYINYDEDTLYFGSSCLMSECFKEALSF